jgi:hypothetical protein
VTVFDVEILCSFVAETVTVWGPVPPVTWAEAANLTVLKAWRGTTVSAAGVSGPLSTLTVTDVISTGSGIPRSVASPATGNGFPGTATKLIVGCKIVKLGI